MTRTEIATCARALAILSDMTGVPIPHAIMCKLASQPGSDWRLVDGMVVDAHADTAADRRRADPAFWAV